MKNSWQEDLKILLNCDLKTLYPLARSLNRRLEFYVGPTNSGKTYNAMKKLKEANSGLYLAPLRLLALEGYEDLKEAKIEASLITGEEQQLSEDAAHICSTIEMLDFDMEVDVAVIDEVQMLEDDDRGWAWVNAIIGVPAKKVIMTGSVNALEAIKKIAQYLGEDLEIVKHKRKNPLIVLEKFTSLDRLEDGTALIAFSRAEVLKLKQRLQKKYSVSVIYGNLSPEVRRDEAKRFRRGESQILIATDAISMGLNLPIKTILFTTDTKFDGVRKRKISVNEIVQIAGRAGRFGLFEAGYLGATRRDILNYIEEEFEAPIKTIKPPFKVKINNSQLESLSMHLKTKSLGKVLNFFALNMKFDGPFEAANLSSMLEASRIVDSKEGLSLEEKYLLAQAPITTKSTIILQAYNSYIASVIKKRVNHYKPSITLPKKAITQKDLLLVEDEVKKISLYLWLSYKLPNLFPDHDKAFILRNSFNSFIEKSLKGTLLSDDSFEERRFERDKGKTKDRNSKKDFSKNKEKSDKKVNPFQKRARKSF
ncbi:HELICc and SUV3_C domain-containing protein [Aliarcobacter faecis]|uniref:helicase-related protein n=1 Tax=Aliarcobacter faecis TaxID=1564138 RepID=UPI0004BA77CE|nr:helicase-related protein [Aliarcobacter faecis]QKF72375.1 HELICc and SUV3_C domain-containing protein [Aliarcobacter faecis]